MGACLSWQGATGLELDIIDTLFPFLFFVYYWIYFSCFLGLVSYLVPFAPGWIMHMHPLYQFTIDECRSKLKNMLISTFAANFGFCT